MDGIKIKPLVWEQISDRTIEAAGVGSTYRIQTAQDGSVRWQSRYMGEWHNAPSIDAAKDAVSMFHEDALSQFVALAPTDAAQAREAALWEAAAKATEYMEMHSGRDMNSYRATLAVHNAILALIDGEART